MKTALKDANGIAPVKGNKIKDENGEVGVVEDVYEAHMIVDFGDYGRDAVREDEWFEIIKED